DAFRSVTSKGSEIGGLLLGTISRDGRPQISIYDYELVDCDYSRGPLYRLSDLDRQRMAGAIRSRTGEAVQVVGFFRSNTRNGLHLDEDDLACVNEFFSDPLQIALLVRPFATRASVAGYFLRENGVPGATSAFEFPFSRTELARTESAAPAPPPAEEPAKPAARAQIVPIASRRETAPALPPVELEPQQPQARPTTPEPEPVAARVPAELPA